MLATPLQSLLNMFIFNDLKLNPVRCLLNGMLLVVFSVKSPCQTDTNSVYKNLEIKKSYAVNLESHFVDEKAVSYKVNGRRVDAKTYQKFDKVNQESDDCCPCFLREYTENEVLIRENVVCGDCGVGVFKGFFPSGKVKIAGQFKENPTGNWEDISARGYCNVRTGIWFYYNELNGFHYLQYIEKWDNGQFIEQKPESNRPEIWGFDYLINAIKIDTQAITIAEFKTSQIIPKYKNKLKYSNLRAKVSATVSGVTMNTVQPQECAIEDVGKIDIETLIEKAGIKDLQRIHIQVQVYESERYLRSFQLLIKK